MRCLDNDSDGAGMPASRPALRSPLGSLPSGEYLIPLGGEVDGGVTLSRAWHSRSSLQCLGLGFDA